MSHGGRSERARALNAEMFSTLARTVADTPTQQTFLSDTLDRLDEVAQLRATRTSVANEGAPSVLWTAIALGAVVTLGFALLFGVSNQRLHYLMVGAFAAIIALQIFVILVLNYPFSGDVRVSPEPIAQVARDYGRPS
jgi:predicted lysophospholipase L1 biosynthesis ABC-type transport system permease subunit